MKYSANSLHSGAISHLWILKYIFIFQLFFSQQLFSQAPVVSSFTPTSAALGNTVTITGTNFTGASAVSFGGIPAVSFTVLSSTQISAKVPATIAGSVSVTKGGQTATKTGFYYLSLSGIITDFAGYWPTTTVSNNVINPDDSHNLLAFTYNGITYSTGVNNGTLTGQGITYTAGDYRSLPVANIAGTNSASSIYLAMASKVDGNAAVANASAVAGLTVKDVLTDGPNGLNMGTGITNLPMSAVMTFDVHLIDSTKISDAEPDILITQIADPSSGNDVFQFIDSSGNIVGNSITQDMTLLTKLGTYGLDLFTLSPGAPFNSAKGFSSFSTNTTRNIWLAGFKIADFGITLANYGQVAALKITPSGTSDYAFIAFNAYAIEIAPNISQNIEKTNSSICAGGTANLEVITRAAYGGLLTYLWEESTNGGSTWFTVSNGGSYSGATTNRLTIVAALNSYKYRATVTESGTGYSSTCSPFTISLITPTAPSAVSISPSTTTCLNNLVSLSGTVTGGSNLFYQWETNASGVYANIPGAILKTYLPPVSSTSIISYRLKVSSGSGCSGAVTSSAAIITVVGISSVAPASRCGTGMVSLSATATSGTISWYATNTGGVVLGTGTSYSPSIAATTTYYVNTDATQCSSGVRVPVTATINSITWAGTNTTAWSTLANWDCGGTFPDVLPTPANNITIPTTPTGGRFPTISGVATVNNITISTGASITVATGGNFEIYGSIANSGTFTATDGTISMRGSTQQVIPANSFTTNTIKNLTINNTSGVLLEGPLNLTGTFTPIAGTLTTFGHLTLKSDPAGTARVAEGSGTYILGNVNVERYVPAKRSWRLMTAPLTNSNTIFQSWQNGGVYAPGKGMLVTAPGGGTGIDSAGNSSLKIFNVTSQALQVVSNTKVPISARNNGSADNTGYFVFVRGDREKNNIDHNGIKKNTTTLTSTGYLQTGTQVFSGLSPVAGCFSLVGNPYASPIDLNLILANTGTINIKRKCYVWDPSLNSVGGYVALDDVVTPGTFLPTPAASSQGNYIQSGQAFFVATNLAGTATVEIKEGNKAASNNTLIFGKPAGKTSTFISNLFLMSSNGSVELADGVRADFNEGFSAGIDDEDNIKFGNTNETFGFTRSNVFLATERRPAITSKDTLFFKLTKTEKRNYQFQFTITGFEDAGISAILEDSYSKLATPLNLSGSTKINFLINNDLASQSANRFRVVFKQFSTLPVTFSFVKAYPKKDNISVQWKIFNELNIDKYETERAVDGVNFTRVNTTAATGNGLSGIVYNWLDNRAADGDNFYRIKSIGLDGSIQYSQVVKVTMSSQERSVSVYPNPVREGVMNLQFKRQPTGTYTIRITNLAGQLLMKKTLEHNAENYIEKIDLPYSIKPGNYKLSVTGKALKEKVISILVR